jgi:Ca-activated chloride channel homolog
MPCSCVHRKMVRNIWKSIAPVLALFSISIASAQFKPATPAREEPRDQTPTFSVKVNLVRLLVSVRDQNGKLITDLSKSDFQVADSGTPQQITVFERNTSLPLSVAILIDTSGSTLIDLRYEVQSVQRFIGSLLRSGNPADTFELFSFNWRTNLELDFSRNKSRAERVLRALHGEGGTSLYDAIYLASDTLSNREGRHVMIIVTDGGDTTSLKKYEDALVAAQQADAVLYPIVVIPVRADAGRNTGGEHALTTLAESTGGRIFNPQGLEQLDTVFNDILVELRTQYLLGFYPKDVREQSKLFHPVRVTLQNPQLKVSARTGYYEP